jgi:GNAT superfamily N-acetyltransferase
MRMLAVGSGAKACPPRRVDDDDVPVDLTITPATPADVPVILLFIRMLADYEKLAHAVVADEPTLRRTLFGERPYAEVLIARAEGAPAGFALFFHNYSTFLARPGIYLEDLFVVPAMRGRGIGKALLREVARIARARGCGRLEWSVLNWNTPAIEFYESLGARPLAEWTMYRMTDDVIGRFAGDAG